jgi:hypothetical protein
MVSALDYYGKRKLGFIRQTPLCQKREAERSRAGPAQHWQQHSLKSLNPQIPNSRASQFWKVQEFNFRPLVHCPRSLPSPALHALCVLPPL